MLGYPLFLLERSQVSLTGLGPSSLGQDLPCCPYLALKEPSLDLGHWP